MYMLHAPIRRPPVCLLLFYPQEADGKPELMRFSHPGLARSFPSLQYRVGLNRVNEYGHKTPPVHLNTILAL